MNATGRPSPSIRDSSPTLSTSTRFMMEQCSGWRAQRSADRQMLSTLGSATVGTPRRSGAFLMTSMTDQHPAEFDTTTFAPRLGELLVSLDPELFDRLHDDVTLRASGVADWAGSYDGKVAALAYAAEIGEAFPDMATEVIDTLVSATRISVLVQLTVRRGGAEVSD